MLIRQHCFRDDVIGGHIGFNDLDISFSSTSGTQSVDFFA